ncbi:MAG: alpha/beta hydrolase-fold protein [Sandaracinus sp.]
MSARHLLLDSPSLGRRAHVWTFGSIGRPLVVFPSNAGVAHEWQGSGMIDALGPLMAEGRLKIYCPETNVSRSFSGEGSVAHRMAHHRAYERFVLETLVPFIYEDCNGVMPIVATGCSVGALYSSLFVLKYPEVFQRALCLSGRYRTSKFFDLGRSAGEAGRHNYVGSAHADHTGRDAGGNDDLYFNDPLAFLPNLSGGALERVRRRVHLTVVVGRGAHEDGCIPETAEFGSWLERKGIPNHVSFWGKDSAHTYPWWQKQARHYLSQMF